ncbi:MAG: ADP-ribosylation factor-like protein [Candidatus Hodarchaeales archaeon]|jgi:small GTP-binding protein
MKGLYELVKKPTEKELVLLGLGEGAVGKTTLVYSVAFDRVIRDAKFTCGFNNISFQVVFGDRNYGILMQEFGGQEQFGPWLIRTTPAVENADVVLLFFDLSFVETLYNLEGYIKQLRRLKPSIKIVLVGNKADLKWNVTPSEIEDFRREQKIEQVTVTSSIKSYNCLEPFKIAIATAEGLDYQVPPIEPF